MAIKIETPGDLVSRKDGVTARLHWDPGFGARWSARYQLAQTLLDQEVLRRTEPYVPLDSGLLKDSRLLASAIGEGLLVYATPYAAAQYYKTADTRTYDPLRGGHWFERMKADNREALAAFVRKAVGGR